MSATAQLAVPHHNLEAEKSVLGAVLLDGLMNSCFSTAQALLTAHSELLRMAQQALGSHHHQRQGVHRQQGGLPPQQVEIIGGAGAVSHPQVVPTARFRKRSRRPEEWSGPWPS